MRRYNFLIPICVPGDTNSVDNFSATRAILRGLLGFITALHSNAHAAFLSAVLLGAILRAADGGFFPSPTEALFGFRTILSERLFLKFEQNSQHKRVE